MNSHRNEKLDDGKELARMVSSLRRLNAMIEKESLCRTGSKLRLTLLKQSRQRCVENIKNYVNKME
jgi:hypothetical protein